MLLPIATSYGSYGVPCSPEAVGAGSSIGNAFRSAFGHSSVKRGCLPWLVQLSPPSSRCMSPSRESTCVPEESLPKSAWPLGKDMADMVYLGLLVSCLGLLYLERRGSVFYRLDSLLSGLLVATLGGLVQYSRDHGWEYAPDIHHHYGFQALAAGVTFAIVFRTQLAWNRYWEAVTQLHFMYSKYADAYQQFYAFAEVTKKHARKNDEDEKVDMIEEKQRRLRANFALLSTFSADRLSNGDNQRMEELHSHRIRSRAAMRVDKEWKGFQLPEMVERGEFQRSQIDGQAFVVFERPTREQIQVLSRTFDAVSTVMYWIIWDLVDCIKDLDVPPPIQSRMYQELSNGMLGFYNCLKIADVPFPLPYAQLLGLLLIAFSCLIPFYVIIFTSSAVIGPILCFFLFESLWCLNEVAKELENPFGQDLNDISVLDFHIRFVDVLEDVGLSEQNLESAVAKSWSYRDRGAVLRVARWIMLKGPQMKMAESSKFPCGAHANACRCEPRAERFRFQVSRVQNRIKAEPTHPVKVGQPMEEPNSYIEAITLCSFGTSVVCFDAFNLNKTQMFQYSALLSTII
eukprot:s32_g59.t1